MMVVFAHANEQFMIGLHRAWRNIGWSGVDLFFVISGFVMTYTAAKHAYTQWGFLRRRLARIVPMYWLMTALTAVIAIAAPGILRTTRFSPDSFIRSLLFLPGDSPPLLHLGWTLNYEMFFYVGFTIFLGLSSWPRIVALATLFVGLVAIVEFFHPTFDALVFYGNPVTFEFLFGCLIGAAYLDRRLARVPLGASLVLLVLGLGLMVLGGINDDALLHRAALRGIPAAIVAFSILSIEQGIPFRNRWLHKLGDATFSIYLTHIFVVMGLRRLWLEENLPTTGIAVYAYVAICVSIAAATGVVAYETIEVRLTKVAKRLFRI
ncbi:putative Exopolysaccharide production protein ExoZ [Burkholderiales bacterium]|jgi:peptidoglycan/LPS O-acetylase OafA/YrhL|nr:putative Exopolysaccharide production protein ExoZ [Burkholderiales bacterium]